MSGIKNLPGISPVKRVNLAQTKRLPADIIFSRASSGTYINSDGEMATAADNVPRFEHDSYTGECKGFLHEMTSTNYVLGDPAVVPWNLTSPTLSVSLEDGWTKYDIAYSTVTSRQTNDIIPYENAHLVPFTFSVEVKNGTSPRIAGMVIGYGGTGNGYAVTNFSLSGEGVKNAISFNAGTLQPSRAESNIRRTKDGYRISMTVFPPKSPTIPANVISFIIYPSGTGNGATATGTQYFRRFQFEPLSHETSYIIPNGTSYVSRAADYSYVNTGGMPQGSMVYSYMSLGAYNYGGSMYYTLHDPNFSKYDFERIAGYTLDGVTQLTDYIVGNLGYATSSLTTAEYGNLYKTIFKSGTSWDKTGVSTSISGKHAVSSARLQQSEINRLTFGTYIPDSETSFIVRDVAFYPSKVSDVELSRLTAV